MLGKLIRRLAATGTDAPRAEELLREARLELDRSRPGEAVAALDRLLEREPRHAEALFLRGTARLEQDRPREALVDLQSAADIGPPQARFHYNIAVARWRLDEGGACQKSLVAALALDADFAPARQFLDRAEIQGEHYAQLLERIHRYLSPRTYLEIGTDKGNSLLLADPGTRAIGIDPEPKIAVDLGPNASVYAETSDEFFAGRDARELLGGPIELAFIDGMHLFEFALRDFINMERFCAPGSTILVHDVWPRDRETAERERKMAFWSGDVWRLIPCLKKYRPELSISTVGAPPTGLAVIRNLDPASRVLSGDLERIGKEFLALDYSAIESDRRTALNWCPNDWDAVRALFQRTPD